MRQTGEVEIMASDGSEDSAHPSDSEATEAASILDEDATAECSMAEPDIDDVLAQLCAAEEKLPEQAIIDARRLRPQIIPRLIEVIQRAADTVRSGQAVTTNGPFLAMYLLTEFRAKEALPTILDAVTAQTDELDLFGDMITEDLNRILAVLAVDEPDVLAKLIDDPAIDMYVRWNAASTYQFWVRDELITREAAVERLRQHLINALRNEDFHITAPLICSLSALSAIEAEHEMKEAYQRNLIDDTIIDEKFVERALRTGESHWRKKLLELPPSSISDTIAHLSGWAYFQETQPFESPEVFEPRSYAPEPRSYTPATRADVKVEPPPEPIGTIRHAEPHVGRNDPCPCGSGKKYKKCCAGKRSE